MIFNVKNPFCVYSLNGLDYGVCVCVCVCIYVCMYKQYSLKLPGGHFKIEMYPVVRN